MNWLIIINTLLATVFNIWEKVRQIEGPDALPEWDEIAGKNAMLQKKIDAEKPVV
jgi:hypothetical protein